MKIPSLASPLQGLAGPPDGRTAYRPDCPWFVGFWSSPCGRGKAWRIGEAETATPGEGVIRPPQKPWIEARGRAAPTTRGVDTDRSEGLEREGFEPCPVPVDAQQSGASLHLAVRLVAQKESSNLFLTRRGAPGLGPHGALRRGRDLNPRGSINPLLA